MNNGGDDSWRSDRYIWGLGGRDAGSGSAEAFRTPKGESPEREEQLVSYYDQYETMEHPLFRYFSYEHLPENLRAVSKPFNELAVIMDLTLPTGTEKTTFFRKLLEAKDAAVRSALDLKEE